VEALHPLAVHLPIAVVLLAPAIDAIGFFAKKTDLSNLAIGLYVFGVIASLFATATGQAAFDVAVDGGATGELLNTHADDANLIPWLLILLVIVRVVAPKKLGSKGHAVALVLGFAMWPYVFLVGQSGGALVFEHGIGVKPRSER
jgi:uncharacterized membrane protein